MACKSPYMIQNPLATGSFYLPVPCGKCYDCKMKYAQQWCFRIMQEEKICDSSLFVTLTYNTDYVPITNKGLMSLDSGKHLKNYFKKLRNFYRYRKVNPDTGKLKYYYDKVPKIKYYAVGEYGSIKKRPHYHLVIFNCSPKAALDAWPYGDVHIGDVTGASVMYTLKYIMKDGQIPMWKGDDRIPEYKRSSIKIGISYLSKAIIKYHRERPDKPYITTQDKYKIGLPRYFKNKIWSEEELKTINPSILDKMQKYYENQEIKYNRENPDSKLNYDDYGKSTSDRKRRHENAYQKSKRDF